MVGPQDRGSTVLAVTAALMALATVFVALRLVSRIAIVKKVSLDDYFIILAWLIAFALSFSICDATHYGLGRHEADIPSTDRHTLYVFEYIFTVLYNPALMATKTSILIFYLHLSVSQRIFRWTTIMVLVVVNVAGLALTFLNIFVCRPMSVIFVNPKPDYAHCTDIVTLYLSSAPVNIVTDLFILLLPMPVLKTLRLPRKQKIILYVTFGFGIFVAAVDVVRISYLQGAAIARLNEVIQSSNGSSSTSGTDVEMNDFAWYASLSFMWSAIEVNVGIMCACVPALKPLVVRFLPRFVRDTPHNSPTKQGSFATMASQDMAEVQRIPSLPPQRLGEVNNESEGPGSNDLGLMDFLTTPDMNELPNNKIYRTDTVLTNSEQTRSAPTFFDFVNMTPEKPITRMSGREAVRPVAEVTILFFLWGFAYGLANTLNAQFQKIANMSPGQTIAIHSCYFAGYLVGPPTFGRIIFNKWGFKACYMVGLVVWGTGSIIFWPAAVLTSFAAFVVSGFIVGLGLSTLEIAANPFIALCGPSRYMEARLLLSQAIQACGTVVSPLLASKILFKDTLDNTPTLIDVQWTYLAICLFAFLLAFVYYCIEIPEASDAELELAAETNCSNLRELRSTNIMWVTLGLAAFAQFLYVGGQESVGFFDGNYFTTEIPRANTTNYGAITHTLFAASRFLAALFCCFIQPRYVLALFFTGLVVFSALAMNFSGLTANIMVAGVFLFEGPLFCLLFAIPLRGLGKYTKDGSALLTTAICGGGVFPPIYNAVAQSHGYQYAYCVVVATYSVGAIFAIYCNIIPPVVRQTQNYKLAGQGDEGRVDSEATTTGLMQKSRKASLWSRRKSTVSEKDEGSDVAQIERRQDSPQEVEFITAHIT